MPQMEMEFPKLV